jgi:hypothetical protein
MCRLAEDSSPIGLTAMEATIFKNISRDDPMQLMYCVNFIAPYAIQVSAVALFAGYSDPYAVGAAR